MPIFVVARLQPVKTGARENGEFAVREFFEIRLQ